MRTIIAGSRSINNPMYLHEALAHLDWEITRVICGNAYGADTLGKQWAMENNIPITFFTPKWDKYGKSAGMIRNAEMAKSAEALIALWDGYSKGTGNMIDLARRNNLKVYVQLV
jgi:YspA, cpYpsA-related SLOG family